MVKKSPREVQTGANRAYKVALGGIVSSLCLVFMVMTGVMPAFYIVLPMLCGILIKIISFEINAGWAALTYFAVSLLCVFINPNIEGTLIFVLFFGLYPVLQYYFDKIKNDYLRIPLKLIYYLIAAVADYYLTIFFIGIDESVDGLPFANYWREILICCMLFFFAVYDYFINVFADMYHKRLRKKFFKK